jgi:hypothetical protein
MPGVHEAIQRPNKLPLIFVVSPRKYMPSIAKFSAVLSTFDFHPWFIHCPIF